MISGHAVDLFKFFVVVFFKLQKSLQLIFPILGNSHQNLDGKITLQDRGKLCVSDFAVNFPWRICFLIRGSVSSNNAHNGPKLYMSQCYHCYYIYYIELISSLIMNEPLMLSNVSISDVPLHLFVLTSSEHRSILKRLKSSSTQCNYRSLITVISCNIVLVPSGHWKCKVH